MKSHGIQWRPWGPEAFDAAREAGKPVFLCISALWCHWCHVMDEESYTHPEVVRRLNTDFIPVRVDSDRRPDINQRYNMGGWPSVLVLDADGRVVVGSTYLPPGQLLSMLSSVTPAGDLSAGEASLQDNLPLGIPSRVGDRQVSFEETESWIADWLHRVYDRQWGGFGGPPKFPQPWAIDFCLHRALRPKGNVWLEMALGTLDRMREGEIHDLAEGGFFRYATSMDWDFPHYEKLLDVNAQLLAIYLKAYLLTDRPTYRATAGGILDYLSTTLKHPRLPAFCSSQSADREYYRLGDEARVWAESPEVDLTPYTDRNALAVSGLIWASWGMEVPGHLSTAIETTEFLWRDRYRSGRGMLHSDDPELGSYLGLSDQIYMMAVLLDLFESTGQADFIRRAEVLLEELDAGFWDAEAGAYRDCHPDPQAPGLLKVPIRPFTENAAAVITLIRLSCLTGRASPRRRAEEIARTLQTDCAMYKHYAAPLGVALNRLMHPPVQIVVVGRRPDPGWRALLRAAHRIPHPWKVIQPLTAGRSGDLPERLGYLPADQARAYVCVEGSCLSPFTNADELPGGLAKAGVLPQWCRI